MGGRRSLVSSSSSSSVKILQGSPQIAKFQQQKVAKGLASSALARFFTLVKFCS